MERFKGGREREGGRVRRWRGGGNSPEKERRGKKKKRVISN